VSQNVSIQTESVLLHAVHAFEPEVLEALLKSPGINVNVRTCEGRPLLHEACSVKIAEKLLTAGDDPNMLDTNQQNTALLIAVSEKRTDAVRLLLRYGANINFQNCRGETALSIALRGNHLPVVKELLDQGCDINNIDQDADKPMLYVNQFSIECLELLLERGVDPNISNSVGATPLWNAVYMNRKKTVKMLLKANVVMEVPSVGISVCSRTRIKPSWRNIYATPQTPLWVAFKRDFIEIALMLFAAGYDVHKETWIYQDNFPRVFFVAAYSHLPGVKLKSTVLQASQNPAKLKALCRKTLRRLLGVKLMSVVQNLDIPITFKNYLTLADMPCFQ